jgi:crossover junction endodeoxyribonuclease RuvC
MIGIDLSLTGTALAWKVGAKEVRTVTLHEAGKMQGLARRDWIHEQVLHLCMDRAVVCIEGLSLGSNMPSAQERAGVWFRITDDLQRAGHRVIVVPPSSLKKFVAGKGNAEKSMMIREVYRRWGVEAANDNEADAAGLLMVGLAVTGDNSDLTAPQREVVNSILTPKVKKAKKAA